MSWFKHKPKVKESYKLRPKSTGPVARQQWEKTKNNNKPDNQEDKNNKK